MPTKCETIEVCATAHSYFTTLVHTSANQLIWFPSPGQEQYQYMQYAYKIPLLQHIHNTIVLSLMLLMHI